VKDFGSFDKFKSEFSTAAAGHFGSGWAWLVQDKSSKALKIIETHDAGCVITSNFFLSFFLSFLKKTQIQNTKTSYFFNSFS